MSRNLYKCLNCGAEYDPALIRCPYCGQENPEKAQEHYHKKITRLNTERRNLKNLPGAISRKVGSKFFLVILGLVLLVIIAGIFAYVGAQEKQKQEIKTQKNNAQHMEELLREKDYEGLMKYSEEVGYAYLMYDKYDEVVDMYRRQTWLKEDLANYLEPYESEDEEFLRKRKLEDLAFVLVQWNSLYRLGSEYTQDTARRGNEEYLQEILDESRELLKQQLGISEEDLDEIGETEADNYEERLAHCEEYAQRYLDLNDGRREE